MYRKAQISQVPQHKIAHWIHRKYKHITITRETSYGLGDSFPCQCCRASLERLDLRVLSIYQGNETNERINNCIIPSKITLGQQMKRQPERGCVVISGHVTRRSSMFHKFT